MMTSPGALTSWGCRSSSDLGPPLQGAQGHCPGSLVWQQDRVQEDELDVQEDELDLRGVSPV